MSTSEAPLARYELDPAVIAAEVDAVRAAQLPDFERYVQETGLENAQARAAEETENFYAGIGGKYGGIGGRGTEVLARDEDGRELAVYVGPNTTPGNPDTDGSGIWKYRSVTDKDAVAKLVTEQGQTAAFKASRDEEFTSPAQELYGGLSMRELVGEFNAAQAEHTIEVTNKDGKTETRTVKPDETKADDLLDVLAHKLATLPEDAIVDTLEMLNRGHKGAEKSKDHAAKGGKRNLSGFKGMELSDEKLDDLLGRVLTVRDHNEIRAERAAAHEPASFPVLKLKRSEPAVSEPIPVREAPVAEEPVATGPRISPEARRRALDAAAATPEAELAVESVVEPIPFNPGTGADEASDATGDTSTPEPAEPTPAVVDVDVPAPEPPVDPEAQLYSMFDEIHESVKANPDAVVLEDLMTLQAIQDVIDDEANGLSNEARQEFRTMLDEATDAVQKNSSPEPAPAIDPERLRDARHGVPAGPVAPTDREADPVISVPDIEEDPNDEISANPVWGDDDEFDVPDFLKPTGIPFNPGAGADGAAEASADTGTPEPAASAELHHDAPEPAVLGAELTPEDAEQGEQDKKVGGFRRAARAIGRVISPVLFPEPLAPGERIGDGPRQTPRPSVRGAVGLRGGDSLAKQDESKPVATSSSAEAVAAPTPELPAEPTAAEPEATPAVVTPEPAPAAAEPVVEAEPVATGPRISREARRRVLEAAAAADAEPEVDPNVARLDDIRTELVLGLRDKSAVNGSPKHRENAARAMAIIKSMYPVQADAEAAYRAFMAGAKASSELASDDEA